MLLFAFLLRFSLFVRNNLVLLHHVFRMKRAKSSLHADMPSFVAPIDGMKLYSHYLLFK